MLQFGILLYFCVSSGFLVIALHIAKRLDRKASWIEMAIVLLFGPVYILVKSLLDVLYPPSKDPFDLVYVHLSFSEGKESLQILREIKEAGETIGWGASSRIESLLQAMVIMGHARSKVESLRKHMLESITANLSTATEYVDVDMSPELHEKIKQTNAKLEGAERNNNNGDLGTVTLYYRGVPPKKGGKKFFRFSSVLRPGFAWQH